MSYTPTEWKTGDIITAEKLNNIEQGIVDAGVLVVTFSTPDPSTTTASKTYEEIVSALESGKAVIGVTESLVLSNVTTIDNESMRGVQFFGINVGKDSSNVVHVTFEGKVIDGDNTITNVYYDVK